VLGSGYFSLFVSRNWVAGALFVAALGAVNGYFAINWRLFGLLEKEDWPALVKYLEAEVYRKGRVRAKHVRLLANAYLLTSSSNATRALEQEVRRRRPALATRLAVPFGIPYLFAADTEEAERYYSTMAAQTSAPSRDWLRWNLAFCLCRRGQREGARAELEAVLGAKIDPVLRLLALYLLDTACGSEGGAGERAARGREELRKQYTANRWERVVENARSNLEVVVLSKVIRDAGRWLYGAESPDGKEQNARIDDAAAHPS
jgi:hypothetical protein